MDSTTSVGRMMGMITDRLNLVSVWSWVYLMFTKFLLY